MEHKVALTLPLPADPDSLWRQLDRSVRNQIRKAERSGLTIEFGGTGALDDFYAVFATRMRELGSPVHGRPFFDAIVAAFGSRAGLEDTLGSLRGIEFVELEEKRRQGRTATLQVRTVAEHTNRTEACSGTLQAVRRGNEWRVEPGGLSCQVQP